MQPVRRSETFTSLKNEIVFGEEVLGEGKFGIVRRGLLMPASLPVAVKTILKNQGGDAALFEARDEVEMMHEVAPCLHISAVHGAFEDPSAVHIVSPIYSGGELFDRIVQWHHSDDPNQVYTERMAAVYTKQLFLALERCHSRSVMHRDIKPENLLLHDADDNAPLVLVDFGLATKCFHDTPQDLIIGTPSYIAPEVLAGEYSLPADMWSAGVVTFLLLAGEFPFYGDNPAQVSRAIRNGAYKFDAPAWKEVSPMAQDLIRMLFTVDPAKRITASEALRHPWIVSEGEARDDPLHTSVNKLVEFNTDHRFKQALLGLMASLTQNEELDRLREIFTAADLDGTGSLDEEEVRVLLSNTCAHTTAKGLIDQIDSDGDGKISMQEFLAAAMSRSTYLEESKLRAVFDHLDYKDTGSIDIEELTAAFGQDWAGDFMEVGDTNNDGVLSYEEYVAVVKKKSTEPLP